jgi:WD40 repeat protein
MSSQGDHDWIGRTLVERYHVTEKLGAGGMGTVFKASDIRLNAEVVIKVPHPVMMKDVEFAARFRREIRSLVKLSHPGIVKIMDVGVYNGLPFAVMQYLSGGSLADRSSPCALKDVDGWLPGVADALDFMHSQGLIHRDIKPDNILFDAAGRAYLGDFGIAKVVAEEEGTSDAGLTGTGTLIGTAEYMAPEMLLPTAYKDACDERVDQYSLAVTAYEMLSGRPPFRGGSMAEVAVLLATKQAAQLHDRNADIPKAVSRVVSRALRKRPEQRFETCQAFAASYSAAVGGKRKPGVSEHAGLGARPVDSATRPRTVTQVERPAVSGSPAPRTPTIQESTMSPARRRRTMREAAVTPERRTVIETQSDRGETMREERSVALDSMLSQRQREDGNAAVNRKPLLAVIVGLLLLVAVSGGTFAWFRGKTTENERLDDPVKNQQTVASADASQKAEADRKTQEQAATKATVAAAAVLQPIPGQSANEGEALAIIVQVADRAWFGDGVVYKLSGIIPSGCTLDGQSGALRWTPGEADGPGKHQITVRANFVARPDLDNQRQFIVRVKEVNRSPIIDPLEKQEVERGTPFRVQVHATDLDVPANTLSYSLGGDAPAGASIDQKTGELKWTPMESESVGIREFTVQVSDGGAPELQTTVKIPVTVFNWVPGAFGRTLDGRFHRPFTSVAFSPDGKRLAATGNLAQMYVVDDGQVDWIAKNDIVGVGTRAQGHVSFHPNGRQLASGGLKGVLCVRDADTGRFLLRLKGHTSDVESVVYSPDGKRLASASRDKTVKVWDADTGQELLTVRGQSRGAAPRCVAFSPDGSRLVLAESAIVSVRDVNTGRLLLLLKGHASDVESVVYSPDGKRLASASRDKTVKVWDANKGRELLTLEGHDGHVLSVCFNPKGNRLASASVDGTVRVWDANTGRELFELRGHAGKVHSVAFSPDGKRLASAHDYALKVWDLETVRVPALSGEPVALLRDDPKGKKLIENSFGKTGNAASKGSFTVWTVPEVPQPDQHYYIVIQVKLPKGVKNLRSTDLSGRIECGDSRIFGRFTRHSQWIPWNGSKTNAISGGAYVKYPGLPLKRLPYQARRSVTDPLDLFKDQTAVTDKLLKSLPVKGGYATLIIKVPGGQKKLFDQIDIRSKVIGEAQTLKVLFSDRPRESASP